MKLLLDTHIFIWWDNQPANLSHDALTALQDVSNELFLSVVSIWEMQIKSQLSRLVLHKPLRQLIESQQQVNGLQILSVEMNHVFALDALPHYHKDPFDRLLIAQANDENMTLVSADNVFPLYGVNLIQ
jgi:PIN domain nuclease of toxin-antitoxin system